MDGVERGLEPAIRHGAKVHVQPTVTAIFRIALYRATRLCGHSAVYHRKLSPRTTRLNLVTNRLAQAHMVLGWLIGQ